MGLFSKKKVTLADVKPGKEVLDVHSDMQLTIGGTYLKCDDGFLGTAVVNKLLNGASDLKVKCDAVHATSYGRLIYRIYAVDVKGHRWHIGNLQERNEQILSSAKYEKVYVELIKGREPILHVL